MILGHKLLGHKLPPSLDLEATYVERYVEWNYLYLHGQFC